MHRLAAGAGGLETTRRTVVVAADASRVLTVLTSASEAHTAADSEKNKNHSDGKQEQIVQACGKLSLDKTFW